MWPLRRNTAANSGESVHVAAAYQAWSASTGGSSGSLRRRWSFGDGAGVARCELAHGYGDGGAAGARLLLRQMKKGRGEANGGAGWLRRVLATLRPCSGASWPGWAEQRRRAAVAGDTRRAGSETGRPLNVAIQFVSRTMQCLTTSFRNDLSANRWLLRVNILNKFCRLMYQLQMLFNALVLNRNRNREKSSQSWADSTVRVCLRTKMAKC